MFPKKIFLITSLIVLLALGIFIWQKIWREFFKETPKSEVSQTALIEPSPTPPSPAPPSPTMPPTTPPSAPSKISPQTATYTSGAIKPQKPQEELDAAVKSFYDQWKKRYLKQGCGAGRYYVDINPQGTEEFQSGQAGESLTVSEAHGYGMIIAALSANFDMEAQNIFNGFYWYFKEHPSEISPYLMAWNQTRNCQTPADALGAATDGDMDIAYALLLADRKWGSGGAINYKEEAKKIIKAVWEKEVNQETFYLMLGAESENPNAARFSDFMMNHLKTFLAVSGDGGWQKTIDKSYELISFVQKNFSPQTGLLPDFIVNLNGAPKPAPQNFEESEYDGAYFYNSARAPWRIGIDYLLSGDLRAKTALDKINRWIRAKTSGRPQDIVDGYTLDGGQIGEAPSLAFVAPFAISAMIDKENQKWLNDLWDFMTSKKIDNEDYFGNTLKMLAMLAVSGHWLAP